MTESASTRKPSAKQKKTDETARPYHHGALPQALLEAAEAVLRRDGIGELTLRSIAREAGVSHTASQHHFGDTAGVLSELAAVGNLRLAASMAENADGIENVAARRKAIARGYLCFAVKNPDLMRLMARNDMLDSARPSLIEARCVSGRALVGVFFDTSRDEQPTAKNIFGGTDASQAVAMTATWAFVHGLTMLLIDGRLNSLASSAQGIRDADALVDAIIEHAHIALPGKIDA